MRQSTLDRVLNCTSLPSLSGIAMQVLELTRDPRVSIARIAKTVQNDPALTTKVLRTVNSSYYGLSSPCPNISRATGLLGLNTVKAIVLGFSLVDCTKSMGADGGFDMQAYWRRAVHSAAAARALAQVTRALDPDEAFVCGLLQDIGMLAAYAALREEYAALVTEQPGDHDALLAAERAVLGFDHTSIGKTLGEKWRLPSTVVDCIELHHRPHAAAGPNKQAIRIAGLANLVAGALSGVTPRAKLDQLITLAWEWYQLRPEDARSLVEQTAKGAKELAKTLEISIGQAPDVNALLAQANEQMAATQVDIQREAEELKRTNEELARQTVTDGLTGAYNRAFFDRECKAAVDRAGQSNHPISVLFMDADRFKLVNDTHGHQAGDIVLMELAKRLRIATARVGPLCRYGGEEFVLIAPGVGFDQARKLGELLRRLVCATPFDLEPYGMAGITLPVTISVGVSSRVPGTPSAQWSAEHLTHTADQAVYAAKQSGRNCVRWTSPDGAKPQGASRESRVVLFVDDDPFATKLFQKHMERHPQFHPLFAASLAEARLLLSAGKAHPHLAVIDMHLSDGNGAELIRLIRESAVTRDMPVALISGNTGDEIKLAGIRAGANFFVDKVDLLADAGPVLLRLESLLTADARSAA
jgi:two-component system, cell cycle response regulator